MMSPEIENPGPGANQETGADMEAHTREISTARSVEQGPRHHGPRRLILLAAWLVRREHRRREREIQNGWDAALSLQLDRLTDLRERLAEYLSSERRQP